MSKYIKLEDAIHNINLEVIGRKEYTGDMKANLFFALDDLPTIEASEDCVDRYSVLAELDPRSYEYKAVKELPSVIPKPKEGEWIDNGDRYYRCSLCGANDTDTYRWCHGCGNKMKGAER